MCEGLSALFLFEKHLSFGKCKLVPERDILLDKAKKLYQTKLIAGTSAPATYQGDTTGKDSKEILPEGWALKSPKKATRFNEAQKHYLEKKFNLGQETGNKLDPAILARDMRYARNKDGTRQFKMTPQQMQSFFSMQSSKLRHRQPEDDPESQTDDLAAAREQQSYNSTCALVIREVQLSHPIVFETYNLCTMYKAGKMRQLTVAMLRAACEHFDLSVEGIRTVRLKAPYISLLKDLISTCDCCLLTSK